MVHFEEKLTLLGKFRKLMEQQLIILVEEQHSHLLLLPAKKEAYQLFLS